MGVATEINEAEKSLIISFNRKQSESFGVVYNKLYKELHYYTAVIYANSEVCPSDIIHDIFATIWTTNNLHFTSLLNLKVYIFQSVKNSYKNYLKHNSYVASYNDYEKTNSLQYDETIIESELYIEIENSLNILPPEWAKILKYYLDGWDVEEIARFEGKEKRTIYNTKQKAINMLRQKLGKNNKSLLMMILLLNTPNVT